jgi:RhtB (resistance to homoserine/threonine) family protein
MEFTQGLLLITVVHLLAAASPGPDFFLVTQQTLSNGKRAGLLVSLGIALGLSVHIVYSALGLAAIIASSLTLLWMIKLLGGSYLIYLGIRGIRSKPQRHENQQINSIKTQSSAQIVGVGFLCNVLNPKAPIYFVSLFTIVLSPSIPLHELAIYGLWIMFLQFVWFALVATLLSSPPISKYFKKFGHYIDRLLGGTMILLGIKVITTRAS